MVLVNKGFAKPEHFFAYHNIKQKAQPILCVLASIFVKYDGNFTVTLCEGNFLGSYIARNKSDVFPNKTQALVVKMYGKHTKKCTMHSSVRRPN